MLWWNQAAFAGVAGDVIVELCLLIADQGKMRSPTGLAADRCTEFVELTLLGFDEDSGGHIPTFVVRNHGSGTRAHMNNTRGGNDSPQ